MLKVHPEINIVSSKYSPSNTRKISEPAANQTKFTNEFSSGQSIKRNCSGHSVHFGMSGKSSALAELASSIRSFVILNDHSDCLQVLNGIADFNNPDATKDFILYKFGDGDNLFRNVILFDRVELSEKFLKLAERLDTDSQKEFILYTDGYSENYFQKALRRDQPQIAKYILNFVQNCDISVQEPFLLSDGEYGCKMFKQILDKGEPELAIDFYKLAKDVLPSKVIKWEVPQLFKDYLKAHNQEDLLISQESGTIKAYYSKVKSKVNGLDNPKKLADSFNNTACFSRDITGKCRRILHSLQGEDVDSDVIKTFLSWEKGDHYKLFTNITTYNRQGLAKDFLKFVKSLDHALQKVFVLQKGVFEYNHLEYALFRERGEIAKEFLKFVQSLDRNMQKEFFLNSKDSGSYMFNKAVSTDQTDLAKEIYKLGMDVIPDKVANWDIPRLFIETLNAGNGEFSDNNEYKNISSKVELYGRQNPPQQKKLSTFDNVKKKIGLSDKSEANTGSGFDLNNLVRDELETRKILRLIADANKENSGTTTKVIEELKYKAPEIQEAFLLTENSRDNLQLEEAINQYDLTAAQSIINLARKLKNVRAKKEFIYNFSKKIDRYTEGYIYDEIPSTKQIIKEFLYFVYDTDPKQIKNIKIPDDLKETVSATL